MACGAAALAPLLSPQAVVKRSAARRTGGIIEKGVIAENLDIIVTLYRNFSVHGPSSSEPSHTIRAEIQDLSTTKPAR
jgi:hypothetical protein